MIITTVVPVIAVANRGIVMRGVCNFSSIARSKKALLPAARRRRRQAILMNYRS
jgi:hypothetical protein